MNGNNLHTWFATLSRESPFVGTPQTDFALESRLETLPRELIQNVFDASKDGETPVVNFFYEVLEGEELEQFKQAIDWETTKPHLEAVAADDDKLGVQRALDQIADGELHLLGVEDQNAVGLEGDEDSRGTNYASLVKDFADSTKKEGGGVHGVGASVLWAFSGTKLVLFNSTPEAESAPKLVGRFDLPDHEMNGQEYEGGGWLGVDDPGYDRPVATRDFSEDLAETLHLTRPDADGTTALVVGFREPTRRTRPPETIVDELYETAALYYWPLIVDGGIEVTVQGPDDASSRSVDPRTVPRVAPYVEAYETWENPSEEFGEPGTVAVKELEFEVPPTESEPAKTGELLLVVRLAGEGDYGKHRNDVAMFRGARHVVKYRDYGSAARTTGKEFHALLLAGGAKHPVGLTAADLPEETDRAVESFFRAAEPEAHDTWETPTQKLANAYDDENPSQRIVSFLKADVKQALAEVLADAETDDDDRVQTLGEEFPYFEDDHGGGGPPGPGPGPGGPGKVTRIDSWCDGAHHYEGRFQIDSPPVADEWTVTVSINKIDGSNRTVDQLDVASGHARDEKDHRVTDDGEIEFVFEKSTAAAEFVVTSEDIGDPTLGGQTRLVFDFDLTGGGSS
jgi:hypothetical protein